MRRKIFTGTYLFVFMGFTLCAWCVEFSCGTHTGKEAFRKKNGWKVYQLRFQDDIVVGAIITVEDW